MSGREALEEDGPAAEREAAEQQSPADQTAVLEPTAEPTAVPASTADETAPLEPAAERTAGPEPAAGEAAGSEGVADTIAERETADDKTAEAAETAVLDKQAAEPAAAEPAAAEKTAAGEGEEGWSKFAPVPPPPPTRARMIADRVFGRAGRFIGHEWTLAAVACLIVAAGMTWPTLRHPATTIPQDTGDPLLVTWDLAWSGHALTTNPAGLWNGNAFYPERFSYAFSDTLLGYAPFGMIGHGPVAALVRYNILFVLIVALGLFGCYALVRQLGAGRTGAAVAAAAVVFAPWRLSQTGHLHVLSIGGMLLSLAMLARGHGFSFRDGYRPEKTKWGWVLAGWLTAAWQMTIGFGIGLPFAYLLLAIVLVMAVGYLVKRRWIWRDRRPFGLKLILANIAGGLAFAAVTVLMAYPYLQVVKLHPNARRPEDYLAVFSPPLNGFFIAPPESALWGNAYAQARAGLYWAPEMTMLPGFFLYGLAAAGLFVSIWTLRQRVLLLLGVVVSIVLAMGTNGPDHGRLGYLLLYRYLPGFDAIRTPGRLVLWTTLLLAILAGGAVGAFAARAVELHNERNGTSGERAGVLLRLATLVPLVLVLVEGLNHTPHPVVPKSPVAMHTIQDPAIVLPSDEIPDMAVMLWSTDGFPRVVNGGSGFQPQTQAELRNAMKNFPDQASVDRLRALHIRSVVVLRNEVNGTDYQRAIDAPIDGLNLTRTENGDVITYKVN